MPFSPSNAPGEQGVTRPGPWAARGPRLEERFNAEREQTMTQGHAISHLRGGRGIRFDFFLSFIFWLTLPGKGCRARRLHLRGLHSFLNVSCVVFLTLWGWIRESPGSCQSNLPALFRIQRRAPSPPGGWPRSPLLQAGRRTGDRELCCSPLYSAPWQLGGHAVCFPAGKRLQG